MANVPFDGLPSGIFTALEHIIPGEPIIPGNPGVPGNPVFQFVPAAPILHEIFGEAPTVTVDVLGLAPHDPLIG